MNICPNINTAEWKALVDLVGEDEAWRLWKENDYEIPSTPVLEPYYKPNKQRILPYNADESNVKKAIGIKGPKKEYSWQQTINIANRLKIYNNQNQTSHRFVRKQVGQSDLWTIEFTYSPQIGLFSLGKEGTPKDFSSFLSEVYLKKLNGFTSYYEQNEAVNVIASNVLRYLRDNKEQVIYKAGENVLSEEEFKLVPLEKQKDFKAKNIPTQFNTAYDAFIGLVDQAAKQNTDNRGLQLIQSNKEELKELVKLKLNSLGLITKRKLEGINFSKSLDLEEDLVNETYGDIDINTWAEGWVFKYDAKANANKQIKQFLSFIPKYKYNNLTGNNELVESSLGKEFKVYYTYDEVFETLKALLTDTEPVYATFRSILEQNRKTYPAIDSLLSILDNYKDDKERLQYQLVKTLSSTPTNEKTMLVKTQAEGLVTRLIDTDRSSLVSTIMSDWSDSFVNDSGLVTKELAKDTEAINKYLNEVRRVSVTANEFSKGLRQGKIDQTLYNTLNKDLRSLLKDIGIEVTDKTLHTIITTKWGSKKENYKLDIGEHFSNKYGLFTLVAEKLKSTEETTDENILSFNPILSTNKISTVIELANMEAVNNKAATSSSYINGKGDSVQSYSLTKFLTSELNRLVTDENYVKDLLSVTFNKPITVDSRPVYETWLHKLNTDPNFKNIIQLNVFDTYKEDRRGSQGKALTELNDTELEALKVNSILTAKDTYVSGGKTYKIINYLRTVPAKTTAYFIQGLGLNVDLIFPSGNYKINKETADAILVPALTEYNRIKASAGKSIGNNAYKKGSNKFFFYSFLNKDSQYGASLWNDNSLKDLDVKIISLLDNKENTVEEEIKKLVASNFKSIVQDKIQEWTNLGIINGEDINVNADYKALHKAKKPNELIQQAAAEYVINSTLAKFNTHQLFVGDPALYFKKDVKTTWDNIDKRLASLIAPYINIAQNNINEVLVNVKLADNESKAYNLTQLQKRIKDYYKPYEEITTTDAQEYTTLKEALHVEYRLGNIPTATYKNILDRINKEGDNLILTKEEISLVFAPHKPVYSGNRLNKEEDYVEKIYIKSSSIPLLPQFTKGLELDRIRKGMEKLEKSLNTNPDNYIGVRAAYVSATKVGGIEAAGIWEGDNVKEDIDFSSNYVTLKRQNFGIQQELPNKEEQDVTRSTQVTKQLFDSLLNEVGFLYKSENLTGQELYQKYLELHKALFNQGLERVYRKLTNNEGDFISVTKLSQILKEEVVNRNGSSVQLESLDTIGDTFEMPLWANNNIGNLQSLITSIFSNNILKQPMHGKSYVLVSEAGFKGNPEHIIKTKNYDPSGLKPMRIAYKKEGKTIEHQEWSELSKTEQAEYIEIVKPGQVILTWPYKNISLKKYLTEDGYLDTSKIPLDVLRMFGFRIPNQGHSSMSLIEVVGILPNNTYGDMVIASKNLVTQMGSDFDVDKLYVYQYKLNKKKDGIISKAESIQNQILDVHKSVLFNPKVFNNVVSPLPNIADEPIGQELKKIFESSLNNYLHPDYDKRKFAESVDGKTMVGIDALFTTFLTTLQNGNVELQQDVEVNGEPRVETAYFNFLYEGKKYSVSNLSNPYDVTGKLKKQNMAAQLSGDVDNESKPIIAFLNANSITASVKNLLTVLGVPNPWIFKYLTQPVVKEYVKRVKANKDKGLSERFILNELYEEQLKKTDTTLTNGTFNPLDYTLGIEEMTKTLNKTTTPVKEGDSVDYEKTQFIVLSQLVYLKEYADTLTTAASLSNLDSKGIGDSILAVANFHNRLKKILANNSISDVGVIDDAERTISGIAIQTALNPSYKLLTDDQLIPYNKLLEVYAQIEKTIGNRELSLDTKEEIFNDAKALWYSSLYTREYRNEIFFDTKDNKSLATLIKELKKTSFGKNNPFVQRLNIDRKKKENEPSLISYNAFKLDEIDGQIVYQGFLDLVTNENEEIRKLGQKVVDYFYLAGGVQQAREWGKYISPKYLKHTGFLEKLKNLDLSYANLSANNFVEQYFQHRPYRLNQLRPEDFDKIEIIEGKNMFVATNVLLPALNKDKVVKTLKVDSYDPQQRKRVTQYTDKFAVRKPDGTYNIYKFVGLKYDKEGNAFWNYSLIPQKGKYGYKDYEVTTNPEVNELKQEYKVVPDNSEERVLTNITQDIFKPLEDKNALQALGEVKYNRLLADYLQELPFLENTKVYTLPIKGNGLYTANGNKLMQPNSLAVSTQNLTTIASRDNTLIHETIHAALTAVDKNWVNPTLNQKVALEKIKVLRNTVREQVINGLAAADGFTKEGLAEFESLFKKFKDGSITQEETIKLELEDYYKYYGIAQADNVDLWQEFVTALFDSRQNKFRQMLNNLKYDSNKSFFTRVKEVIVQIIKEFARVYKLGTDITKGSALEEALYDSLAVLSKPMNEEFNLKKNNVDYNLFSIGKTETEQKIQRQYHGIINDFRSRLNLLNTAIGVEKANKNKVEENRLQKRKEIVQEELSKVLEEGSYELITEIAKKDLDYAAKILDQPKVNSRDLVYTERLIATYLNITNPEYGLISESVLKENTLRGKELSEIEGTAYALKRKHERIAVETLTDAVQATSGLDGITKEVIQVHKPLNIATTYFLDLSRTGDITLEVLDKWLRQSDIRAKASYEKIDRQITISLQAVLKNKDFKDKGWELFFQYDKNNKINGRLIEKIGDEYYRTREELLSKAKKAEYKSPTWKKAWSDYHKWVKENHLILNLRKLVTINSDNTYTYNPDSDYLIELRNKLGEDYDRLLQDQIDKIKQYNSDLTSKAQSLENSENSFIELEQWIEENSPIRYIENIEDYKEAEINGKKIHRTGWSYVVKRVDTKWEDARYKTLLKPENKDLKDFYDLTVNTLYELYGYLPYDLRREFGGKSIPHIMKNLGEQFKDEGFAGARSVVHDNFIKSITFTQEEKDVINKEIAPETKAVDKTLKVNYLDKKDPKDITTDLGRILRMFSKEVLTYKYKARIEDSIRLTHSVLSKSLEQNLNGNNVPIKNAWGQYVNTRQATDYKKRLDYILEVFYGERKKKEGATKASKVLGMKLLTKGEKVALETEKKRIKDSTLTEEEKKKAIADLENQGKRYFSWGKFADGMLQYIQIKAMGWNPFSAINNVSFGWLANFNYATGGVDFTTENMLKANQIMLSSVVGIGQVESETAKKIRALMVKFDTLKEILDSAYKDSTDTNRLGKLIQPLEAQRRGEYFVQGMTMVALMLNKKVKVGDKEYSVWESFDNEGKWKHANKAEWGEGDIDNAEENKEFFNLKLKLDQVVKRIHGNYDPNSPILAKKWVFGRAVLQFRSWIAEGIASRYEGRKFDLLLNRQIEGRYRTAWKIGTEYGFGTLAKTLFKQLITANNDKAFADLNLQGDDLAIVKENMKKNLAELMQKLSLTALAFLLAGFDDDEEDKAYTNFILNSLYRIGDDIEFYASPIAAENILRTAVPAAIFITDASKFLDALGLAIVGEDEIPTGNKAGQSRLLLRTAKIIPLGSSIATNISKVETVEAFRN